MSRILIVALMVFTLPAMAQQRKKASAARSKMSKTQVQKQKFKLPFKLIPTVGIAHFTLAEADVVRADQGLHVGVLADFDFNGMIFQTGLTYLQAGGKMPVEGDNQIRLSNANVRMEYLVAHAAVKKFVYKNDVYLKGGVSPMLNTRSEMEVRWASDGKSGRHVEKLTDIRDLDLLAEVGAGFELPQSYNGMKMGAELTFHRGMLNVIKSAGADGYNQGMILSGFVAL